MSNITGDYIRKWGRKKTERKKNVNAETPSPVSHIRSGDTVFSTMGDDDFVHVKVIYDVWPKVEEGGREKNGKEE